ncbi:MAG: FAD:protein FMN transferase [Bacteroidota bacterium]
MKHFLYLSFFLLLTACQPAAPTDGVQIVSGETMGTYYRVSYWGQAQAGLKTKLDSVLVALNDEVSTYIPTSAISRFNNGNSLALADAPHFLANWERAQQITAKTDGYFNPTVMPLVNYWGFGYTPKNPVTAVDSIKIDSLMQFVGTEQIEYLTEPQPQLRKRDIRAQLDFSAIAKGYGVDLLAQFLSARGINSYLVDIGGESVASGYKGSPDQPWVIGISVPLEEAALNEYLAAVPLRDQALATSGNYRNFYEVNGQKYSHTINPFTGYPERSRLLSASVLGPDCTTADAFATACMVAGRAAAFTMIDTLPDLEAYFVYADEQGELQQQATEGFPALKE